MCVCVSGLSMKSLTVLFSNSTFTTQYFAVRWQLLQALVQWQLAFLKNSKLLTRAGNNRRCQNCGQPLFLLNTSYFREVLSLKCPYFVDKSVSSNLIFLFPAMWIDAVEIDSFIFFGFNIFILQTDSVCVWIQFRYWWRKKHSFE